MPSFNDSGLVLAELIGASHFMDFRAPRSERVLGFEARAPAFVPYAADALREDASA